MFRIFKTALAVTKDIITIGGTVNNGYFKNGNQSYTARQIEDLKEEKVIEEIMELLKKERE